MGIFEKIKCALGKGSVLQGDEVRRLTKLPKDQAQKEFAAVLFEQSVSRARDFVNSELRRGDSPFQGVSGAVFFHEMLAVTFWLVDKEIAGGKKKLMDEFHNCYFSSFELDIPRGDRQRTLAEKYAQYEDTWNDLTGHFDEFGLCVVQNIFGKALSIKTRERTFFIIQYADEIVNIFCPLRKLWKNIAAA